MENWARILAVSLWLASVAMAAATIDISAAKNLSLNFAISPPYYPTPFAQRAISDDWVSAFKKAEQFVSQLTITEKVNLTSGIGWMMGPCVGNTGDIPRLNFTGLCLQDGPLGVRSTNFISAFPAGITAGSTFNKELIYNRGQAIAREHKYKGVDVVLGPVAGPLGLKAADGRSWEGFGADPYLAGVACAATVRGIQDEGLIATAKHFIGNEQEHFRQYGEWKYLKGYTNLTEVISSNIDDRTLHEVYAWPFADMIRVGVGSVMCAYNQVNNSQSCQNSYLLNNILKEQMGFPGFVTSDWGGLHSGVASALAGTDMNMPGGGISPIPPEGPAYFSSDLTLAVLNSSVPLWRLDDMAVRIMAAYFKVGRDRVRPEVGPPNFSSWTSDNTGLLYLGANEGPSGIVNMNVNVKTPFSTQIAEQVASEGIVLLKNINRTLPLNLNSSIQDLGYIGSQRENSRKSPRSIGILGIAAGPHNNGPNCNAYTECTDGGVMASGFGSGAVSFPFVYAPFERINERAIPQGVVVDYDMVDNTVNNDWSSFDRIVKSSDVNIIVGSATGGESQDRQNLSLWYGADAQIVRAASMSNNVIVVINSVGPINVEKWIDNPNVTAVIFSGPQGEFAGESIAQVLFGEANPSGRLPFTIAKNDEDYVPIVDQLIPQDQGAPQDNFYTGLYVDYKYFEKNGIFPRYEFGYGLSYSNWEFSSLEVRPVGSPPSEYLPLPPQLRPVPNYNSSIPPASQVAYPPDIPRYNQFLYPYIENTTVVTGRYPYPMGYSDTQPQEASLAGGAPGGNPALWAVAYQVKVQVTNKGPYGGAYVAQLYIGLPQTRKFQSPRRQLRGFEKVSLPPGQSTIVNFDLMIRDLSVWDTDTQSWIVQRGTYIVYVGSSSRNLEQRTAFTI
ncbi:hypothetical protein AWJ20_3079 [Sugiyamaella lignohabitans]|uniref:beta-glucosidase n=1 Tax=Sugiyamaella lignohabitans TaxID=796027 RepID=A0A167FLH3_9ASCO|nr:uncharacterized protein AWJ20_3079 [Sugiyamaella lignohabitans]ANB15451.1 hypothetical protein AWJ20_3079 [Sugiyamaella lignohabitans]